jgi:hypothetical protein
MKKKILKSAVRLAAREIPSSKTVRRSAMKAGKWAMRRVGYDPGPDYGSMALRGLGAAAVTLPIGYLIGRRLMSHPTTTAR